MNHPHAPFVRRPSMGLVSGFGQSGARDAQILAKQVECNVVLALEERMWRDRRELCVQTMPADSSAVGRLRARIRDFFVRMQLGPVADDAAGRDPETRF